jgi:hypothetical protein
MKLITASAINSLIALGFGAMVKLGYDRLDWWRIILVTIAVGMLSYAYYYRQESARVLASRGEDADSGQDIEEDELSRSFGIPQYMKVSAKKV